MMTSKKNGWWALMLVAGAAAFATVGCAGAPSDAADAPEADDSSIESEAIVYTTNADGTWSGNASVDWMGWYAPGDGWKYSQMRAKAVFTGPSGKKRKMGVCALKMVYNSPNPYPCSTAADCPAPPTGGANYCTDPYGGSNKYCFQRLGSQTSSCGGSPALGGAAVSPGTYYAPTVTAWSGGEYWISYGCFEGCAATDPSTSSITWSQAPQPDSDPCGGGPKCGSQCC